MKQFFLTLTLLSFSFSASAGWPAIEGQLVDSLGEPILEADVDFKVEIFAPGTSCKMSEETFDNSSSGYNLSDSRGSFSLSLGNSGNTPVFPGAGPDSYDEVFKAGGSGDDSGTACNAAMPSGAERDVRVSYSVSGGAYNSISSNLRYGGAASAATLNGIPASDFLRDNAGNTTQANLDSMMNALFGGSPNQDDVLKYDSGSWIIGPAPGGGGGEANDGANVGSGTGQIYKDKTGTDINFKTIAAGSTSLSVTNNTNDVTLDVVEANINHDNLSGFVANEHVDHSSVSIATAADSGLAGGGDLTTTRNISVDISGTTAETAIAGNDELLIYDDSAAALRKITYSDFTSGILTSESDPGLQTLTTVEVDQLENIGTTTVSATQWGYLGAMGGQPLESESDTLAAVTGRGASTTDAITIDGSADAVQLTIQGHSTQTTNLNILELENSAGTVVGSFRADGATTAATDLATKSYVDTQVGGAGDVSNASNQGAGGVGAFITKNSGVLQFKNINAGSSKLSVANDGVNNEIDLDVVEANIDHDSLSGFVANEHIDHSGVSIATAAGTSGLSGGGNITTTRNVAIDIAGTTDVTSAQAADTLLIRDDDDSGNLKEISRANFLSGYLTAVSINDLSDAKITGVADVGPPSVPVNTSLGFGTEAMDMFTGPRSLAVGYEAMKVATTGTSNTALGFQSMVALTTGKNNTAVGALSLAGVTTGEFNTAVGDQALDGVTNGTHNIGIGYVAGTGITGGIKNIVIGHNSGLTIGTGGNNILIGDSVDVGGAGDNDKLNIGNALYGNIGATKRIGINTSMPLATLDVNGNAHVSGSVKVGSSASCVSGDEGTIRWNLTILEVCDGTAWKPVVSAPGPMPGDEPTGAWNLIGTPGEASSFYIENAADNYATGAATLYTDAQVACAAKTSQTNRGIARVCSIDQLQRACLAGQIANGTFPSSNIVGAGLSTQIVVSAGGGSPGQCVVDGSTRNFTSGSQDFYCCMD